MEGERGNGTGERVRGMACCSRWGGRGGESGRGCRDAGEGSGEAGRKRGAGSRDEA